MALVYASHDNGSLASIEVSVRTGSSQSEIVLAEKTQF